MSGYVIPTFFKNKHFYDYMDLIARGVLMDMIIKCLLVDDHLLVRTAIKKMLANNATIVIADEASSGEQAYELIKANKYDVIIMDILMPGIGGIGAIRKIMHLDPKPKILALTSCSDVTRPSILMSIGVLGYITKEAGIDEMILAINKVASGRNYIGEFISQKMAIEGCVSANQNPFKVLTSRELQVVGLIVSGINNKEIAKMTNLSIKTVLSHKYRSCKKLNIRSDAELTRLMMRYEMIVN